ncbi:uncharacterized protein DUF1120 [Mycetohabitans endofungorum]|uniref:Uncharacterized protein DUF1120 n=2 Tax=Burkholderiaceae TaxID=119060 RepID=A0A2P5K8H6_9BURK|nr:uncharacterized protein DUF1120 [Mycetohabitans endofungorum]
MEPLRSEELETDRKYIQLGSKEVELSINCPTNTSVGIVSQNEVEGYNPFMDLGSDDNNTPLQELKGILSTGETVVGVYALMLDNMSYSHNGHHHMSVPIGRLNKGEGNWSPVVTNLLNGEHYREISWKSSEGNTPAVGSEFSANIVIMPFFRPAKEMDLSREIIYRGQTTITLTY